jgi:hypothetical protein
MSSNSTVKRTPLSVHEPDAGVTAVQAIVAAGTASPEVQASPVAKAALADLETALSPVPATLTSKANAATALSAARTALTTQFAEVEVATRTYEASVNGISGGDPAIIARAGLLVRGQRTPAAALGVVTDVRGTPGKQVKQSILQWPEVPGATSYAIQVNWTPATPAGPWTALTSASSRRRVITAPAQGVQFLAQVAAISSDGTQSAWCDAILVTAK